MNGKLFTLTTLCLLLAATPAFAQEANEKPKPEKKPEAPKTDPFAVPDGKPGELVKYIQSMQQKSRRAGKVEEFKKYQKAIIEAAGKVLKQKPDDKSELVAVQAKFTAYGLLSRFGDAKAAKSLLKFAESLKGHQNKAIAEMAESQVMTARARTVTGMKPAEQKEFVEDVLAFAEGGDIRKRFGVVIQTARGLEAVGSRELAAKVYNGAAKVLAKSKDPQLSKYAKKMEGSARRVMLLGNTIDIKGTTVDGKPFDWKDYKGKVVLVDFWATWCGPCVAELPNVKNMYQAYHDKGFEVVGISLDTKKAKLEKFIEDKEIPWTNLFSSKKDATGWDHPMATYYGVMGIPNVILVDQKGKVVSLSARGRELQMQLAKLLGPVESPKEKTTDGDKPDE